MFAIKASRCFDGVTFRGPTQVVVDGERIVSVGAPEPVATNVTVLDAGDATLLPGLIDAHTHLTWDASPDAVEHVSQADDAALQEQARVAAHAALKVGITTVRDLGDRAYAALRLRDEVRRDPASGPEIVAAGPPITIRNGHCGFLGGEADTADELRAAVRDRYERGVDVVKVMATGGEMTPRGPRSHESQYDADRLRIIAEAAHALGLPVTAHAHGAAGATDAIRAGFDSLEHGGFWTETGADVPAETVDAMRAGNVGVVLTLAGRGMPDLSQLPLAIAARYDALVAVAAKLWQAGVRLAYASDAGIAPGKEHDVLAHSLARAAGAAPSPSHALRAMTSAAAEICNVADRKGRIAVGYDADLLVVAGDPVERPDALGDTQTVIRAGRIVR